MTDHLHVHGTPQPATGGSSTPAWKLLATLAIGGAVVGAPARIDTLYLVGDRLSRTPPAGVTLRAATKVFEGFDAEGKRLGVAVEGATPGFADMVRLLIGFDPGTGTLTGYALLDQKETPGLGNKIESDSQFAGQFRGKVAPLTGTKSATTDPRTVQTITGATISSRAVIRIINETVARWQPLLAAFDHEAAP